MIISDDGSPSQNAVAPSPCKEIRAACPVGAHRKGTDISGCHAGIDCTPACAIVGRGKNAITVSPCKEIRAAHRKGIDRSVRQAGIDRSPACAIVGRGKGVVAGNLISDLFEYLFTYPDPVTF